RRHQKIVEVAPAPGLSAEVRTTIAAAAVRLASELRYASLGTFEFLVDADDPTRFAFIEANPRLQVEHTVTEELLGIDLVAAQLRLAAGQPLASLGLPGPDDHRRNRFVLEARVNAETLARDGSVRPSGGVLERFEVPTGPGVRVDTCGYAGYRPHPGFDTLLAKVVVSVAADDLGALLDKAGRAPSEFRLDGGATTLPVLRNLVRHPDVAAYRVTTRFLDENVSELVPAAAAASRDPLAVLEHGKTARDRAAPGVVVAEGAAVVRAPMQGTV